jgi:hypothetical protein
VQEAIDEFFDQRKPDDLLLFYFSGHGVRDEFGALYLAFRNTMRTRLRGTAIKSDYIREAMDQSRSKRQVVILDCCNSGAFPQGTKAAIGGPMGMGPALGGYGRFVLMASDSTQFAWEGDKVIGETTQNSLFTHFLVKGLQGDADRDSDGKISVDDLYDYTYDEISRLTSKQTPTKAASKVEGEFVLREITRLEDIKPIALPADLVDETEDTRPYVREAAVQKLIKILGGRNIGMARTAAEALERIAADDNTTRRVADEARQAVEAFHAARKAEEDGALADQPATPPPAGQPSPAPARPVSAPVSRAAPTPQPKPVTPARPSLRLHGNQPLWIAAIAVFVLVTAGIVLLANNMRKGSETPQSTATEAAETATVPPTAAASLAAALVLPVDAASATAPIPQTGIGAPRIGNTDVSTAAWNAGVPTLRDKATEKYTASDNSSPVSLPYTVRLGRSDQVLWEWYWCSQSQAILDDNLSNVELKFVLDGQDVTPQFIHAGFTNGGWYCRIYFVSLDSWLRGSYHLTTTAHITRTISDGTSDYIAGDYIDDYTVNVP